MSISKRLFLLLFTTVTLGCTVDLDITDLTLKSASLDLSDPDAFDFDDDYVEFKDGELQLKPLDLNHSQEEFSRGRHSGSAFSTKGLSLLKHVDTENTHVAKILPSHRDALIGYWRADENISDEMGNFSSTSNGASISSEAQVGPSSLLFDGVDNYLESSDNNYTFSSGTISMWVKDITTGNKFDYLVSWGDYNTTNNIVFWVAGTNEPTNTGKVKIQVHDELTSTGTVLSSSTLGNAWRHLVVTFSSNTIKIYFDGVLDTEAVVNLLDVNPTGNLFFGSRNDLNSNRFFDGHLDDIAIWKTQLGDQDIQQLYNQQSRKFTELRKDWTPKWNHIVGYWKMDGNWDDASGEGNHCTPLNDPILVTSVAKVGLGSGRFNGVAEYCEVGTGLFDFDSSTEFSSFAWVKSDHVGDNYLFGTDISTGWYVRINSGNGHTLLVKVDDGINDYFASGTTRINDGAWHHLGIVKKIDRLIGYVDGNIEIDIPIATLNGLNDDFHIGRMNGNYAVGNFDDLAIWSTALSVPEVRTLYNRQKQKYAGHYDSPPIDTGVLTSNWSDFSWTTGIPFGKELIGDFNSDGNPDHESSSDYPDMDGDLGNGLVGYWSFNEIVFNGINGNDFEDHSANHNHANEIGGVIANVQGLLLRSIELNGSNYVEAPDSLDFTFPEDQFSVSVWFKAGPQTEKIIFSQYDTGASDRSWAIMTGGVGQSDKVRFIVSSNGLWDSTSAIDYTSSMITQDRKFHNAILIFDKGLMKIYIDGVEDTAHTAHLNASISSVHDGSSNLSMGARFNNGMPENFLNGNIDEAAIWSRAITENEIQLIYRRGANRIKLQVKSCIDSSCNCKGFSASPTGSINDCDGDGISNADDTDDIYQAEFMGPGGDGTTFFSELINRRVEDITFDCDTNTSDFDANICVNDEVVLAGSPRPSSPHFSFDEYLDSVEPQPNRYFKYRVSLEADENTACKGAPCLPELTSINLNPLGPAKFFGQPQTITSKQPLPYTFIKSARIEADSCVRLQVSPDGNTFYIWSTDQEKWISPVSPTDGSSAKLVEAHLRDLANQLGPGNLFVKAFLSTDTTTPCAIRKIEIETSESPEPNP